MYVTYEEYKNLGYESIENELVFKKYELKASLYVDKITLNRLVLCPESLTETNKIGICEIIESYYKEDERVEKNNGDERLIKSYTNRKYSETYTEERKQDDKLKDFHIYFTPEQLYRGVSLDCNIYGYCCKGCHTGD